MFDGASPLPALQSKLALVNEKGSRDCFVLKTLFEARISRHTGGDDGVKDLTAVLAIRPSLKPKAALLWCAALFEHRMMIDVRSGNSAGKRFFEAAATFVPLLRELDIDQSLLVRNVVSGEVPTRQQGDMLESLQRTSEKFLTDGPTEGKATRKITHDFIVELLEMRAAQRTAQSAAGRIAKPKAK